MLERPKVLGVVLFGQINLLHKQIGRDLRAINTGMTDVDSGQHEYPRRLRIMLGKVCVMREYLAALIEETEAV